MSFCNRFDLPSKSDHVRLYKINNSLLKVMVCDEGSNFTARSLIYTLELQLKELDW
ncbi:hypothetical protein SDC9_206100 [bioreactor metagenome]|uniref:Uncharacterized protein n=1 Tax=bioreactor metagenome TaxID=1076179 RepID=A0A645J3V2_9ZZZZ